jgi:hypothetical protein
MWQILTVWIARIGVHKESCFIVPNLVQPLLEPPDKSTALLAAGIAIVPEEDFLFWMIGGGGVHNSFSHYDLCSLFLIGLSRMEDSLIYCVW